MIPPAKLAEDWHFFSTRSGMLQRFMPPRLSLQSMTNSLIVVQARNLEHIELRMKVRPVTAAE